MEKIGKASLVIGLTLFISYTILIIFIGFNAITFFYTFLFYIFIFFLFTKILLRRISGTWKLLFISITCSLFLFDFGLRYIAKRNLNHAEINGSPFYRSHYIHSQKIHYKNRKKKLGDMVNYMVHQPNSSIEMNSKEFAYNFEYNEFGLREGPIEKRKRENELRIIALGDSFTEGLGAPNDATWPSILENLLQQKTDNPQIRCINAGIANSDPIFSLRLLRDKLMVLNPDVVVLAVNGSDIRDMFLRGGPERYDVNGKLFFKKGPWWEYFYATSFVIRFMVHDVFNFNEYLVERNKFKNELSELMLTFTQSLLQFDAFCSKYEIDSYIAFMPFFTEMYNGQMDIDPIYELLIKQNMKTQLIYLPTCYLAKMEKENKEPIDYYWNLDFHHNSIGYQMMGECIFNELSSN